MSIHYMSMPLFFLFFVCILIVQHDFTMGDCRKALSPYRLQKYKKESRQGKFHGIKLAIA